MPLNPAPRSLCLLRLSALGDAVHAVALVRDLQAAFPGLPITWILGKGEAKLLEGLDGVELLPFDKKAGLALRLEILNGVVTSIYWGQPDAVELIEGCA